MKLQLADNSQGQLRRLPYRQESVIFDILNISGTIPCSNEWLKIVVKMFTKYLTYTD